MNEDRSHRRWNVQGQINSIEEFREALGNGADSLNWFVPYSVWAVDDEDERDISMTGDVYVTNPNQEDPIRLQVEGYLMMPRVGGCSRVEFVVDEPEDALYICECVRDTMCALMANAGPAVGAIDFLKFRVSQRANINAASTESDTVGAQPKRMEGGVANGGN